MVLVYVFLLPAKESESGSKQEFSKGGFGLEGTSRPNLSGPISRDSATLSLQYPISCDIFFRKICAPIKIKSALPPPPLSSSSLLFRGRPVTVGSEVLMQC